jgi:hypothetical protein
MKRHQTCRSLTGNPPDVRGNEPFLPADDFPVIDGLSRNALCRRFYLSSLPGMLANLGAELFRTKNPYILTDEGSQR